MSRILSVVALVAISVLGAAYLVVYVVRVDPWRDHLDVELQIPRSGGVVVGAPVLLRGLRVGEVSDVTRRDGGVRLALRLDADAKIPAASGVEIESLSMFGENYVNFTAEPYAAPFVQSGAVLEPSVRGPASLTQVSDATTRLVAELDGDSVASLADWYTTVVGDREVIGKLGRLGKLFAMAAQLRRAAIRQGVDDVRWLAPRFSWLGPKMADQTDRWRQFGDGARDVLDATEDLMGIEGIPKDYLTGNGLVPFLTRANERLDQIGGELKPLSPLIAPITTTATSTLNSLDLSALIAVALRTVDPDGGINLTVEPRPGSGG